MNSAQNHSEQKKQYRFVAIVFVFVVLFHCLFYWMAKRGIILDILQYSARPEFSVQNQLWKLTRDDVEHDALFVGDESFIQKMKNEIPSCDCGFVTVPYYQFTNVGETIYMVKKNSFKKIFIQNKIQFWTNFNHTDTNFYVAQNTNYFSVLIRNKKINTIWAFFAEKLIFDLSKQLLKSTKTPTATWDNRLLETLWFRKEPRGYSTVQKNIQNAGKTRVFWITEPVLPFKSRTDLLKKFSDFVKKGEPDIGQMIDQQQVVQRMRDD